MQLEVNESQPSVQSKLTHESISKVSKQANGLMSKRWEEEKLFCQLTK